MTDLAPHAGDLERLDRELFRRALDDDPRAHRELLEPQVEGLRKDYAKHGSMLGVRSFAELLDLAVKHVARGTRNKQSRRIGAKAGAVREWAQERCNDAFDECLLREWNARGSDAPQFGLLCERWTSTLIKDFKKLAGRRKLATLSAEDYAHEVLIRAFQTHPKETGSDAAPFNPAQNVPSAWLRIIGRNVIADDARAYTNRLRIVSEKVLPGPNAPAEVDRIAHANDYVRRIFAAKHAKELLAKLFGPDTSELSKKERNALYQKRDRAKKRLIAENGEFTSLDPEHDFPPSEEEDRQ